jgi:hypothetical protein
MTDPSSSIKKRRLPPHAVEKRAGTRRCHHLDQRRSAESICADEAHPRSRQISGPSKQWAAMLGLRPIRGARFGYGAHCRL